MHASAGQDRIFSSGVSTLHVISINQIFPLSTHGCYCGKSLQGMGRSEMSAAPNAVKQNRPTYVYPQRERAVIAIADAGLLDIRHPTLCRTRRQHVGHHLEYLEHHVLGLYKAGTAE